LYQAKALLPRLTYAEAHELRLAVADMLNRADRNNGGTPLSDGLSSHS
jgi:hypothetical protein